MAFLAGVKCAKQDLNNYQTELDNIDTNAYLHNSTRINIILPVCNECFNLNTFIQRILPTFGELINSPTSLKLIF